MILLAFHLVRELFNFLPLTTPFENKQTKNFAIFFLFFGEIDKRMCF